MQQLQLQWPEGIVIDSALGLNVQALEPELLHSGAALAT